MPPTGPNQPPAYFLQSARLGFRVWTETDFPLGLKLWGDPEVTRYLGGPFTAAQIHQRLDRERETQREHGVQYWPVFRIETGDFVGCCGLRPYPAEEKVLELGFHLMKAHWGRGYGPEAAQTVIAHGFEVLRVDWLFAGHHPANAASRHVLEKLGFRYFGDTFYEPTGEQHPSYQLAPPKSTT